MSESPESYLYLVRHGATDSNLARPYVLQGRSRDHSLSEAGRRQAEQTGRFLAGFEISAVYASPLKRAQETAAYIAEAHGLPVQTIDEICEIDVGRWEGMDWGSVERDFGEYYHRFMATPGTTPYLDGESYGDVLTRVRPAFDGMLDRHPGESIAIVAHNVVNRAYVSDMLGLDLNRAKDIRQSNGGVNVIRRRDGESELIALNGCFHLDELARRASDD